MEVEPSCCEQSCKVPLYETAVCAYCVMLAIGGRLKDTWPVKSSLDPHHADTRLEHLTSASASSLNGLPIHGKVAWGPTEERALRAWVDGQVSCCPTQKAALKVTSACCPQVEFHAAMDGIHSFCTGPCFSSQPLKGRGKVWCSVSAPTLSIFPSQGRQKQ